MTAARAQLTWLAGSAAAVTSSQAITAGGSLILQVVAARELGLRGYGAFALCLSLLTTVTALYTGYVGDGLTVLDRHERVTRRALVMSALVGLVTCWVIAAGMVIVLHLGDWRVAIVYALMIVGWLVEETGRRVLIARLEFWKLVANDGTYMVTTLVALGAVLVASRLTLLSLLACMAFGALCAIALALVQLPRGEFAELQPGPDVGARVARFAVWRSMQATLRPAELLVARVLVLQLVSLTAVGLVEAGRLVVAPIQTVLNGAAAFLLSTGAHGEKSKKSTYAQNTRVAIFLVVITLGAAGFAAVLSHPLGHLMARRSVSHMLVLGWGLWMATWAASLPFTAELTVRTLSRPVFVARLVETCVGLGLVAMLLGAGANAQLVPWLLSAPAVVNTWYIRHLAVTTRPAPRLSALQPAAAP